MSNDKILNLNISSTILYFRQKSKADYLSDKTYQHSYLQVPVGNHIHINEASSIRTFRQKKCEKQGNQNTKVHLYSCFSCSTRFFVLTFTWWLIRTNHPIKFVLQIYGFSIYSVTRKYAKETALEISTYSFCYFNSSWITP